MSSEEGEVLNEQPGVEILKYFGVSGEHSLFSASETPKICLSEGIFLGFVFAEGTPMQGRPSSSWM